MARESDIVESVRDLVSVCRQMWAGDRPPVDGRVVRSSGLPLDFPLHHPVPILIAARGPRMLKLAGELADIVHVASPYLGHRYQRHNLALIADGAAAGGRALTDIEIDLTVSLCVTADRQEARRLGRLTTGAAILWMAGADEFAKNRTSWTPPDDFAVPAHVVDALATRWNMWSGEPMPPDVEELITDRILDQFTVAGTPDDCATPLRDLIAELPEVTGLRFKLPPLSGPDSFDHFQEIIVGAGGVAAALPAAATHLRPSHGRDNEGGSREYDSSTRTPLDARRYPSR